jgi:RNA polymerase sigma-70 factor (ECF subfamily)
VNRTHPPSPPITTQARRPAPSSDAPAHLDPDSEAWVARLDPTSSERDAAVEALQGLLLQAARFEIQRRGSGHPELDVDADDLTRRAAADALVHLLEKLGEFRGQSRFTTWASKFAIVEAGIKARRRAWRRREVPLEPAARLWTADGRAGGDSDPELPDLLAAVEAAIRHDLSDRQRQALVATAVNGVPIDVVAERLQTGRGVLSKTIHAARRNLRAALAARGLSA